MKEIPNETKNADVKDEHLDRKQHSEPKLSKSRIGKMTTKDDHLDNDARRVYHIFERDPLKTFGMHFQNFFYEKWNHEPKTDAI